MQSLAIAIAAIIGVSIALIPVLIGLSVEHHDRRSNVRASTRPLDADVSPGSTERQLHSV